MDGDHKANLVPTHRFDLLTTPLWIPEEGPSIVQTRVLTFFKRPKPCILKNHGNDSLHFDVLDNRF